MNRKYVVWPMIGLLGCFIGLLSFTYQVPYLKPRPNYLDSITPIQVIRRHHIEAQTVLALLSNIHYKQLAMSDSLSLTALTKYLESLDPAKNYFLEKHINFYKSTYGTRIAEIIKAQQLQDLLDIYTCYRDTVLSYTTYAERVLEKGFNFEKEEYINLDPKSRAWATDYLSLQERWRKSLKNDALNLKLSGKAEEEIKTLLLDRIHKLRKFLLETNTEDIFEILMSAITGTYDPHSDYLSAINSQNFNINISKSLEGIGARLTKDLDFTTIHELIPGGPAYKSGQIEPTDRIIGVAEGDEDEFTDIIGWRLDEVVQRIRGKKGTIVRLLIIPAGSSTDVPSKEVRLVRDKINLEDAVATKKMYTIDRQGRTFTLGVIHLPSFYIDWEAAAQGRSDFRSATKDVVRLIEELKTENIEGIVMDLRKNGGGALLEAISLSGIFVKEGPIVQVKDYQGDIKIHEDEDASITYAGPLVVLVDRFSASASEIFAGAMQDYRRALILGEPTYGKGSVQNLMQLKKHVPANIRSDEKIGHIKITLAQYYRVNGESTQNKGVVPHITYPSRYDALSYREAEQLGALAWNIVDPCKNTVLGKHVSSINRKSLAALQKSFQQDLNDSTWIQFRQDILTYQKQEAEARHLSLKYSTRKTQRETIQVDTTKHVDPLVEDHYLQESLWLLSDMISLKR